MNKLFLIVSLAMTISIANAGNLTSEGQRSDRKILEITKIVKLSNKQEQQIRTAYDAYNVKIDSALYEVKDAKAAARIKYEREKSLIKR